MKRLRKTDFINNLLTSAVGPDVDTTNFPVWEVAATSSVPLRGKEGTIFEGGVILPHTLFQLAANINREAAPLMMDHNMEGSPYGKFFYSEVHPNEFGYQELRGYMYVDPTEEAIAAKVDNGTIDEVSIAFAATEMRCNKCGWDYAKALAEDNILPLMLRTCENGHQIGKDGTHLELDGVKDVLELSVVSRGAAKNSKIIGQSDSKLGKQVERLAAHGLSLSDVYVTATASKGFDDMDMNDLIVKLTDAKSEAATAVKDVTRLERELAESRGAQNEASTRAAQLETELAEARALALDAPNAEQVAAAEKDAKSTKASVDFLTKQLTAVLTASGKTVENLPTDVDGLIAAIDESGVNLAAALPINGVSASANSDTKTDAKQDFSMFRPVANKTR